jgi:hypothetical protein
MYLVQLPQCFRIEIDVYSVQPYRHDIVYTHLDGRISPLRSVRSEAVEYLGEGLECKRRSGDLERRVGTGYRRVVFLSKPHGQYSPGHALGSYDGAWEPWGDCDVLDRSGFGCVSVETLFCQFMSSSHVSRTQYTPEGLKPGNRSVKRSSESTPTSPLMRSSSSRRAEIAGRSRRLLLRRLLRGWGTPFGASMF